MIDLIKYHLFPSLVAEANYDKKQEFKKSFGENIFKYFTPEGRCHEWYGNVNIHHEPAFNDFFVFATNAAKQYIASYNVDPELFNFHITKSWLNIIKDQHTPRHSHADAHLSFCYYVNVPPNVNQPIVFHNYKDRYEPHENFIMWNNPSQWDVLNSYTWKIDIEEGKLIIFPSRMEHETQGPEKDIQQGIFNADDLFKHRVSLAADITFTYKEISAKPQGLQPIKNWKVFS